MLFGIFEVNLVDLCSKNSITLLNAQTNKLVFNIYRALNQAKSIYKFQSSLKSILILTNSYSCSN